MIYCRRTIAKTDCDMIVNQAQFPIYNPLIPVQTIPTTSVLAGS
jgi:hypothetical protein